MPGGSRSGFDILINPGTRSLFAEQNKAGPSAGWGGITSGDVDDDGRTDIVLIKDNPPRLNLRKQTSSGTFASANYPMGTDNSVVPGLMSMTAKLTSSDRLDVLAITPMGVGVVRYANSGTSFMPMASLGTNLPTGMGANALTVGDPIGRPPVEESGSARPRSRRLV